MRLTDKVKNFGKALGIAGVLASPVYNSGCLPLAVVGGAAIVAKGNRDAAELEARSRENAAQIEADSRIQSQDGNRYNLNINNGDKHLRYGTPFGNLVEVSCNYIEDFNKSKRTEYPDDFAGIKDSFSLNEKVTVYFGSDRTLDNIEYKVLNTNGEVIKTNKGRNCASCTLIFNDKKVDSESMRIDSGSYKVLWYLNDQLIATSDFIVEKN